MLRVPFRELPDRHGLPAAAGGEELVGQDLDRVPVLGGRVQHGAHGFRVSPRAARSSRASARTYRLLAAASESPSSAAASAFVSRS